MMVMYIYIYMYLRYQYVVIEMCRCWCDENGDIILDDYDTNDIIINMYYEKKEKEIIKKSTCFACDLVMRRHV